MSKRILLLTIFYFLICMGRAVAAVGMGNYFYNPNDLAKATGTVVSTGLNSIEIYDEQQKRVERFVYLERENQYHKGDYIRIFYHPKTAVVAIIKRMTVLEYKDNGQNLGYISKSKA